VTIVTNNGSNNDKFCTIVYNAVSTSDYMHMWRPVVGWPVNDEMKLILKTIVVVYSRPYVGFSQERLMKITK